MNKIDRVAVCSRSFSKNNVLRSELLEKYQNVTFNDFGKQFEGEELVAFLRGHNKAIIGLEKITDQLLASLPDLEVISKYGVGLDGIDIVAIENRGRRLGWVGGVNKRSVSEMVFALAINLLRHLPLASKEVEGGIWRQHIGGLLSGRKVGIVGCGHIGKDLVRLLEPWGCRILANDVVSFSDFYNEFGVIESSLDYLLMESDIVTLHVPLNEKTRNIIGRSELSKMKSTAILINTARGGLVDEVALKNSLVEGDIAAAAFDVFEIEPPIGSDLIGLSNFYATPHLGGSAEEAVLAMGRAAIASLELLE
jgi:D-3-phosphoglycerate dehydrogenase